jgi:outer membrane lipoprotein-sorting protein
MIRRIAAIALAGLFASAAQATPKPEDVQQCKALEAEISSIEQQQRKALSGPQQDQLKEQMKRARDKQFALKC